MFEFTEYGIRFLVEIKSFEIWTYFQNLVFTKNFYNFKTRRQISPKL